MAELIVSRNGEESPTTHLDFALDDSTMTASGYAQVVFHNVQERYPPGAHIECKYTLTRAIRPSSRDWVGIFKVGWSSTRQYKAFDWAPYPSDWKEGNEYEQVVMFSSYYLPKEEDGEFYQFCFIDSSGKMRGASTPFQFLDRPSEEFVEVEDHSMGILMIQTKTSVCEEQLEKVLKEKEELLSIQSEMKSNVGELERKVQGLELQIGEQEGMLSEVSNEFQDLKNQHDSLLRKKTILEGRLEEVLNALSSLEQDKARCEKALASTKTKLQEAQVQSTKVSAEKNQLVKDLSQVLHERDEFKGQFASSESNNKELRNEISSLLKQLSESSQASQDVKLQESHMREEKRKVEQQLLVAMADKEHIRHTEQKLQMREDQYTACEASRRMLCEEVDTMKAFQHKLSNDLQRAETDKDALKGRLVRQEKEYKEREKKLKNAHHLQQHQSKERETMLQEQVQALKDSITQLAEEKEQAMRSNKGPMEASHIAMKELQDKLKKSQALYREENLKRLQLQRQMATQSQVKDDLTREAADLRVRLQMGAEEYRKKFIACQQLEFKLMKKGSGRSQTSKDEGVAKKNDEEQGTEGGSDPTETQKPFDNTELQLQLTDLARELGDRNAQIEKYRERCEIAEREAMKYKSGSWPTSVALEEKEGVIGQLREKLNSQQADYLRLKHKYEMYKFDVVQSGSAPIASPSSTPPETSPIHSPDSNAPTAPPMGQYMYRNPYTEGGIASYFPNPYAKGSEKATENGDQTRKARTNPFRESEPPQEVAPVKPSVASCRSPPTTPPSGLVRIPSASKLPPKEPSSKPTGSNSPLPEPLKPDVLPEGKIAAIKTVAKKTRLLDIAHGLGGEEDREEGPAEFHDACEDFPQGEGNAEAEGERVDVKRCPECDTHFPPTFPEDDFARHIQQHYARLCPMCDMMMPCETPDAEYERHVQTHFGED